MRQRIITLEGNLAIHSHAALSYVYGRTSYIYLIERFKDELTAVCNRKAVVHIDRKCFEELIVHIEALGILYTARHGHICRRCRLKQATGCYQQVLDGHILGIGVRIGAAYRTQYRNRICFAHSRLCSHDKIVIGAERYVGYFARHQLAQIDALHLQRPVGLLAV